MTKRTIKEIRQIMNELDEKYGFDTSCLPILHNKRLSRALGRCHYLNGVPSKFDFSTLCLNFEYEPFKQIIMHEWAHAYNKVVYNGTGHDKSFKQVCKMIGCVNDGTKINDLDAINTAKQYMPTDYKYVIKCKSCGHEHKFARKTQAWKVVSGQMLSIYSYKCGVCKETGTLEAIVL